MRQIELAIRQLQMIMGLIDYRNYPEALQFIDQAFKDLFGLDSNSINALPLDYLLSQLTIGGVLDTNRCLLLARFIKAEGDIYEVQGDDERSYYRYLRALQLQLEVFESKLDHGCPKSWADLEGVIQKLADYTLPADTQGRLFGYYASIGAFTKAEDLLWQWIDTSDEAKDAIEEGIAFYQQLLTKSQSSLVAANLPRSEIEEGLNELMSF
jgi:tetratricopeptide (TPR) repeat protein